MTLHEFTTEAARRGHMIDNRANASATWDKGWGLGYPWYERWAFRRYTLGNLEYTTGKVLCRHGSYTETGYTINGEGVTRYKFMKALESFTAPDLTAEEQAHIDEQRAKVDAEILRRASRVRRTRRNQPDHRQLTFNFAA